MDCPPFPPTVRAHIEELQREGADGDRLLQMLTGHHPDQPVPLPLLVHTVRTIGTEDAAWKEWNQAVSRIRRHYQELARSVGDEALSQATRTGLRRDLERIAPLFPLLGPIRADYPRPEEGITVRPSFDLSRQSFWTGPVVAFVDYLRPILGSREAAYRATAHLFALAFAYPDQPQLVKRRYLHAQQKRPLPSAE